MASTRGKYWTEEMTANYRGQGDKLPPIRWLYNHTLNHYMGDVDGKSVLDVGCGEGQFCRLIKSKGASRVLGVDLSPLMISFAKEDGEKANVHCEYQVGDARQLEKISEFDFVTITNVLHYSKTIAEMTNMCRSFHRNLKPGGIFYGILINFYEDLTKGNSFEKFRFPFVTLLPKDGESTPLKVILGKLDVDRPPLCLTAYLFEPEEYEKAFLTAGFRSVEHRPLVVDENLIREYPQLPEGFCDLYREKCVHFCYIARK